MSLPACLVTSSPTFEEPERTPPFLMGNGAMPDLRQIVVVDQSGKPPPIKFAAAIRSEDNGDKVWGHLVLDYGIPPPGGPSDQPYLQSLQLPFSIEPGTLDGATTRTLAAKWYPGSNKAPVGCHTVTLFAMHDVNDSNGCPIDPADFDYLTWTVLVCDKTMGSCCDPTQPPESGGCKSFVCPDIDANVRCDMVKAMSAASPQITLTPGDEEAPHE